MSNTLIRKIRLDEGSIPSSSTKGMGKLEPVRQTFHFHGKSQCPFLAVFGADLVLTANKYGSMGAWLPIKGKVVSMFNQEARLAA